MAFTKVCGKCEAVIGRTCQKCPQCGAVATKNAAKKGAKPKRLKGFKALRRKVNQRTAQAATPSPLQTHIRSTLAVLVAVTDLENADPMFATALQAHREAVELAITQ